MNVALAVYTLIVPYTKSLCIYARFVFVALFTRFIWFSTAFSVPIRQIFIFEDENDSGKLMGVNATDIKTFETQHLSWDLEDWNSTKSEAYVTMAGTNSVAFGSEGVINLKVYKSSKYSTLTPF